MENGVWGESDKKTLYSSFIRTPNRWVNSAYTTGPKSESKCGAELVSLFLTYCSSQIIIPCSLGLDIETLALKFSSSTFLFNLILLCGASGPWRKAYFTVRLEDKDCILQCVCHSTLSGPPCCVAGAPPGLVGRTAAWSTGCRVQQARNSGSTCSGCVDLYKQMTYYVVSTPAKWQQSQHRLRPIVMKISRDAAVTHLAQQDVRNCSSSWKAIIVPFLQMRKVRLRRVKGLSSHAWLVREPGFSSAS